MEKSFSLLLAKSLSLLAAAGFIKRSRPKHLLGLMNVDTQHSVLRVPLAVALLRAGSRQLSLQQTRMMLSLVGAFYLAMDAAGSLDREVGGTLPSKLTNVDLIYHFGVGAWALWLGTRSGRMVKP